MELRREGMGSGDEVVSVSVGAISPGVPPISCVFSPVLRTVGSSMLIWDARGIRLNARTPQSS